MCTTIAKSKNLPLVTVYDTNKNSYTQIIELIKTLDRLFKLFEHMVKCVTCLKLKLKSTTNFALLSSLLT